MKNLLPILLIAVLGLSVPFFASAPALTLDQALDKLDAFNKTFRSMQAALDKTEVTPLINDTELSKGEIFYKKSQTSSQIRLDMQTPAVETIVIADGKITLFYPKLKQATQSSTGSGKAESSLNVGIGSSSQDIKKNYDVTLGGEAAIDGKNTAILDLKPKTSSQWSSIRLWIDAQTGSPVQFQLNEHDHSYAIFKFVNPKFNANLPDSKFDVKSIIGDAKLTSG